MVDYTPFLFRAVAALNPNTSEAAAFFMIGLAGHWSTNFAPATRPLSDTDLRAESEALEAAIRRVKRTQ